MNARGQGGRAKTARIVLRSGIALTVAAALAASVPALSAWEDRLAALTALGLAWTAIGLALTAAARRHPGGGHETVEDETLLRDTLETTGRAIANGLETPAQRAWLARILEQGRGARILGPDATDTASRISHPDARPDPDTMAAAAAMARLVIERRARHRIDRITTPGLDAPEFRRLTRHILDKEAQA